MFNFHINPLLLSCIGLWTEPEDAFVWSLNCTSQNNHFIPGINYVSAARYYCCKSNAASDLNATGITCRHSITLRRNAVPHPISLGNFSCLTFIWCPQIILDLEPFIPYWKIYSCSKSLEILSKASRFFKISTI